MPKTLFIGIDISSEDNMAQFMDQEWTALRPSLFDQCLSVNSRASDAQVVIGHCGMKYVIH